MSKSGLRVLLYHSVGSRVRHDAYGLSVSAAAFHDQIRWLREESACAIVPLDRGCADLASGALSGTAVAITFDDGFRDVLMTAAPHLARLAIPFTVFVVGSYLDNAPEPGQYLDRSELRELAGLPGAAVGAHGFTHRPLSHLDGDALDEELRRSRDVLHECLGAPPTSITYPHGALNHRVVAGARAAGFVIGGTSLVGVNRHRVDPLRIRRTELVASDNVEEFRGKVRGHYDWYRVRQRLYWPLPSER